MQPQGEAQALRPAAAPAPPAGPRGPGLSAHWQAEAAAALRAAAGPGLPVSDSAASQPATECGQDSRLRRLRFSIHGRGGSDRSTPAAPVTPVTRVTVIGLRHRAVTVRVTGTVGRSRSRAQPKSRL